MQRDTDAEVTTQNTRFLVKWKDGPMAFTTSKEEMGKVFRNYIERGAKFDDVHVYTLEDYEVIDLPEEANPEN